MTDAIHRQGGSVGPCHLLSTERNSNQSHFTKQLRLACTNKLDPETVCTV